MKRESFLFLSLFLLALFLLFFQLGERSLWEDESRVALKGLWSFKEIILFQKNLLFNIILSIWSPFGKGETWLRIPSVLFALFSLIATYELGKKLFSSRVAILATLLLASSPFFLLESRQVRMYSLVLFLSLVSFYFLILFFETGRFGTLLSHLGLSWMAFLTHYMFLSLYAVELLLLFWRRKEEPLLFRRYLLSLLCMGLLFLPAVPDLLKRLEWLGWLYLHPKSPETLSFPLGAAGKIGYVYYLLTVGPTIYPWNVVGVLIGSLLPTFLLLYALRSSSHYPLPLVFLAFGLPIFLLSLFKNTQPHHAFLSLPFYAYLLAFSLFRLRRWIRVLCLGGLLAISAYGIMNYFLGRQYLFITYLEPYREVAQFVKDHFAPGDFILQSQSNPSFRYYYRVLYQQRAPTAKLHFVDQNKRIRLLTLEALETKFPPGIKRLWFLERTPGQFMEEKAPILNAEKIFQENRAFRALLDRHYQRLGRWVYLKDEDIRRKKIFVQKFYSEERIVLSLYERRSPSPPHSSASALSDFSFTPSE